MSDGSILIIDDSKSVLVFLKELIARHGYTVLSAQNGKEGWDLIQVNAVDLIFSDLEMPLLDGVELCKKVKGHPSYKEIYFIIFSTHKELNEKVYGLTSGADDYIEKNTHPDEILARINSGIRIRNLQKDLQQTRTHLYQQEKMASIGQMAAGVAHEINNPLGFIASNLRTLGKYMIQYQGFVQALTTDILVDQVPRSTELRKQFKIDHIDQDSGDLIEESLEGTARIAKIVQGLKQFSGVDDAEVKPVNLNESLECTLELIMGELAPKITIRRDFSDLPEIKCNGQQMNQVFMNLLLNAGQSIQNNGEIVIQTLVKDNKIQVSITDNGCGMDQGVLHKIFDPFYSTREVGMGTGLGLTISYDIIKNHGGEILVESEKGRGSKFTVMLPVRA
ncbi:MAG: response regulator [Proteobacteria bacterium]|nr:response regulator [Pseudomonadota bacterium]MBU1687486.1 response regulator [Pseudomonadota bacterium]